MYALFPHRFLSGVIKRPQWKTRTYKVIIYDLLQWKCGAILIPSGDDDVNGVANVDEEVNSLFLLEIRYDHNGFVNKTTVFYIVAINKRILSTEIFTIPTPCRKIDFSTKNTSSWQWIGLKCQRSHYECMQVCYHK